MSFYRVSRGNVRSAHFNESKANSFTSAQTIEEELSDPSYTHPNHTNTINSANYQRAKDKSSGPSTDLADFELDHRHILPNFLHKEITMSDGTKHLAFATDRQL